MHMLDAMSEIAPWKIQSTNFVIDTIVYTKHDLISREITSTALINAFGERSVITIGKFNAQIHLAHHHNLR